MSLPEQLLRTRLFTLGVPDRFTVVPDGRTVLYLRGRAGDDPLTCLWALDLDSGEERVLADPAALGRDAGIDACAAAGRTVVFALAGELWTVAGGDAPLPVRGPATDPRPDPRGERIAYLSGGSLRVVDADGTGDRAVADPDGPEVVFGRAEHTAVTDPDGNRGYWWAPDGTRLLVARVDSSAVDVWHLADPTEPARPPRQVRYAAVGRANAEVSLWIAGLDGTRVEARWDRAAFEYLVGAGWDAHGPYAVVQSRDQRTVRFLGIAPADGRTTVLAEQRDDRWVSLVPGLPARTAGGALVSHADDRGTRRLTVDGAAVTPPGLQVRAVHGVDGDEVLFAASEDPTESHLWSWRAGRLRRLTTGAAVHAGVVRDGVVVRVARGADVRVSVLRQGKPPVSVPSRAQAPVLDARPTHLVLGPRALRAALHLPSWHGGDGTLPVLVDSYGGAATQRVTAEVGWRSLVSRWFAEQGFAVLVVDGAGTPGRGPDWEREVHGDLFGPVLDDQVAALREAAALHPVLDLGRVGVRGWSFGGSLAALAVLRRPDVFHAAVAGAGVTDQRLYNAHWRERFLGHPDEFPERYEAASLVRMAPELTRPLLLVHGLADDNVHPANALRLSRALLEAGRPHEVLLLPGVGHQAMGLAVSENLLLRQARFLRRHLGG
ncbi:prolyl oligopeptidase family serine peptidase [Umezawaea endophytica]|uniref:Prolyl oligopeptidase family serine peptidase n=1 Tax=Umezawaea endophytica TaxID=1654476 RepID=A0A9X2VF03_9PSEU|nr:prolyl oligopeptidase family serine peptidase [Umezawaea endophytica]MCS7475242.1 prolyl oligopeptidase family serine peptidase [Umezawaea endophytica]